MYIQSIQNKQNSKREPGAAIHDSFISSHSQLDEIIIVFVFVAPLLQEMQQGQKTEGK